MRRPTAGRSPAPTARRPSTAAFYFDNVRLLPRVVNSEWKGGAPDPDNDPGNGNAAENLWYASMNWVNGVPGVADSTALFGTHGGTLVTPQTVDSDRLVTVGGMTFDNSAGYTLGGTGSISLAVSSGSPAINVLSGNHTINMPVSLASATNVSVAPGSSLSVRRFTGAGLNIQQGTVRISPDGTSAATSNVESLTLAGGATPTASIDLTNNAFVIDYTEVSPLALVRSQIAAGANTGTGIITSSGSGYGVGYAEASSLATVPGIFGAVDSTALLLRGTRFGDANLDGLVNLSDFNALASNFGLNDRDWIHGDFNYDGIVNLADFNRLASNFGLAAAGPDVTPDDWAALAAAVPEPAPGLLALPAATALLRRRRSG